MNSNAAIHPRPLPPPITSNIYDNCHAMESELDARGKSMRWAKQQLRGRLSGDCRPPSHEGVASGAAPHGTGTEGTAAITGEEGTADSTDGEKGTTAPTGFDGSGGAVTSVAAAVSADGGFVWACGGEAASDAWISRPDVRAALHLCEDGRSSFHYRNSGPASVMLWPFLSTKVRTGVGGAFFKQGGA
jgi:hypothetical protein